MIERAYPRIAAELGRAVAERKQLYTMHLDALMDLLAWLREKDRAIVQLLRHNGLTCAVRVRALSGGALDDDADGGDEEGDLDAMLGAVAKGSTIEEVATLRRSARYAEHMERVEKYLKRPARQIAYPMEDDPEYKLIVASNALLSAIDDEQTAVHRFVAELYAKKFPELESLVPNRLDYLAVVDRIRNEMDMTVVDLADLLAPATVMVVSVTGSTTSGQPLADAELEQCLLGHAEASALEAARQRSVEFVESRMEVLAPNVTKLLGPGVAAVLMGLAGGLTAMSKIPACNMQLIGQEKDGKKHLAGYSNAASMPNTGLIYYCDLVLGAPPALRRKALKVVAAKVTLAARIDLHQTAPDGGAGDKLVEEIKAKIEKWQEPDQAAVKKALPAPDDVKKRKRGGKRARAWKEKLRMSETAQAMNRRAFGEATSSEYGEDAMGHDTGMLGAAGGALRATTTKKQKTNRPTMRAAVGASSGKTGGISSSLVFTPVQGIELTNPNAQAEKVRDANNKWFSNQSGFQSAAPR